MALLKNIRQNDCVITNYHRISELSFIHKTCNSIVLDSYIDEESSKMALNDEFTSPYHKTKTYCIEYDDTMTIGKAYEYLKTLPEFEGAVDI